jgi:hypothetical protein
MINTNTNTGGDFILAYYIHKKTTIKKGDKNDNS